METKTCEHCGKVIEGHTEGQAEHNMAVHKIAKHPEKKDGK
jgi:hypothetical protein